MTRKKTNPVLEKVQSLALRFGKAETTICGRAFKDSKKASQLHTRSEKEAAELAKLDELEQELLAEEVARKSKLAGDERAPA